MNTNILIGFLLFLLGQALIWMQTNSQFIWEWAKEHRFIMALCGVPISYLLILASKYVVEGFDGLLWPGRLIGFGSGMVVMAFFTWYFMGEGISLKTLVSLIIACILVLIQMIWK
jgi:hypothetical protein